MNENDLICLAPFAIVIGALVLMKLWMGGVDADSRELTVLEEKQSPKKNAPATGWTPESDVLYRHRTPAGREIKIERRGRGCVQASDVPSSRRGGSYVVTTAEGESYEWSER